MNNLASNGRIEDIAVARDQKGKRMGLRILESLVHISCELGCHKVSPLIKLYAALWNPNLGRLSSTVQRPTKLSMDS